MADCPKICGYQLEVNYRDGLTVRGPDPYAFLPTFGEIDVHLSSEGRHEKLADRMGAHVCDLGGVKGVSFAVWAPNALGVSVVGVFNTWDGRLHPMRNLGTSGIWELFVPGLESGAVYKYEIRTPLGPIVKIDPFASWVEKAPLTGAIVHERKYKFRDEDWMKARATADALRGPLSVYEVHLGSWRRVPEEDGRSLTYREIAHELGDYVVEAGFTHVELMPVMEHPFEGSWGYQVTGYFAPTSRFGDPDDFRYFVDEMHARGIGVLLDWVPAHFPKDAFSLGRFDGTALYEHLDPRQGEHPDWGTYVFNYGRREVRNLLLASALHWLDSYHIDGLRVDAVASMLYLDYSREAGQWLPNRYGGRENLDAIDFLRDMNAVVHAEAPGCVTIAEDSTAWPGVTRPIHEGGLGFTFKWNMGWMHDTLEYFAKDPVYRQFHQDLLTFAMIYEHSENFIMPLSHDEMVHLKGSLFQKMPGDRWQKLANLRVLFAYMLTRPGKSLLFMGSELALPSEWNHDQSLDWHLGEEADRAAFREYMARLGTLYQELPQLWQLDAETRGFEWIDVSDKTNCVLSYLRRSNDSHAVVVLNLTPTPHAHYRLGVPESTDYRCVLSSDAAQWGGSGYSDSELIRTDDIPYHGRRYSIELPLP
ncbi:MAG: 1,4-alpha-glucan branching protein GlgB, partial [Vicinamibacteria bacterium]